MSKKKKFDNEVDIKYCRERIKKYLLKMESLGIPIPNKIAFDERETTKN